MVFTISYKDYMKTQKNMFKNSLVCILSAAILALSGCSGSKTQGLGEKTQFKNLDLENAEIVENTPESGKWYTLRFDYKQITRDSHNVLQEAAEYFGVSDLEKENVLCSVNYSQNEPNTDIVYSEMNDEDFALTTYLRYISDDFYIDYNLSNRFEYYCSTN